MATKTNVFLNWIRQEMIHYNDKKTAEGQVANISISYPESANGLASFGVNPGQVLPQVTGKADNRKEWDGYKSILLGKPEGTRKLSVCTAVDANGKGVEFDTVTITNSDLVKMIADQRAAYKAAQAAAVETEAAPATKKGGRKAK